LLIDTEIGFEKQRRLLLSKNIQTSSTMKDSWAKAVGTLTFICFFLPRPFGSVVAGAFQIAFRAEMHANDFFYFLKIIFDISTSKRSKKYKPHSILAK